MSKIKLTGENSGYVEISAGQNAAIILLKHLQVGQD